MDILTKIKTVLLSPTLFFKKIEKEKGITPAFKYLAIISLFAIAISVLERFLFKPYELELFQRIIGTNFPIQQIPVSTVITSSIWSYILILIGSFLVVAILHLWVKLFKGKAKYDKTYQILVYGTTPSYLFSWVPFLGGLAWIYDIILLVIGTSIIHKISQTRAIVLYIIPAVLLLLLFFIILISIFAILSLYSTNPDPSSILGNLSNFTLTY